MKALKKADPPASTKRYFDSLGLFIEARSNGGLYPNGRAYNRTKFLKQRTEMMQKWADYLDALVANADVPS